MSALPLPASSPEVLVAALANEAVLLDLASKRYFQLNETGKEIWDAIVAKQDRDAVVAHLVAEFDVEPAEAAAAVHQFIDELRTHALVQTA